MAKLARGERKARREVSLGPDGVSRVAGRAALRAALRAGGGAMSKVFVLRMSMTAHLAVIADILVNTMVAASTWAEAAHLLLSALKGGF
jgi:hypothetical protein